MAKVAGIFPIGDTGEVFGVAEWHPDPELIEQALLNLANAVGDMTEPLSEAREVFRENTRIRFEEENDPQGVRWAALDPDYAGSRKKQSSAHPNDILRLTGELADKATSEAAWIIGEQEILFNSAVLPPYGEYHQRGTGDPSDWGLAAGNRGLRKAFGRSERLEMELPQSHGSLGIGRGQALPQRQFIGADELAIQEVEEVFIRWLNNRVDDFLDSFPVEPVSGGGSLMGENVLGSFPIVGYTKRGQPLLKTPSGIRFGRMR